MKAKVYKITDLDRKRATEFVEAAKSYNQASKKIMSFGQRFQACSRDLNELHMFKNIEILALSLGVDTLEVRHDEWSKEPRQKEFIYDDIRFFELCNAKEKYIGTHRKFKTIKLKAKE